MIRLISILICMMFAATGYAQLHFVIDNPGPCAGKSVTFSLPVISGCANPRVASEADWGIYPKPVAGEVRYIFSALNGVNGYVGVTITYATYHPTITVNATYQCSGKAGAISDIVTMSPPVTVNPTITGLDAAIYPGDQSIVTSTAAHAQTYFWQLSVVQVISGSINSDAIVSSSSSKTTIKWPPGFTGVVDIISIASACSTSTRSTKRINVLSPPTGTFYESSVSPSAHCSATTMRYSLIVFGGFNITQAQLITTGGASNIAVVTAKNGVPVEWSVKWVSDGNVKVQYSVSNGIRTWSQLSATVAFDVLEFDPGQLHQLPVGPYCAPVSLKLQLDRAPSGSSYVFQSCNTGDCSVASSNWINNDPPTSGTFTLSANTSFRMKLTDNRCGAFQSNNVSVQVKPTPSITISDKVIFSGGSFAIPASNLSLSTITVTEVATGVSGASNITLQQGTSTGALTTQVLTTTGQSDGSVVYSVTPSREGCSGQTRKAIVTVFRKPSIYRDRDYVYKNDKATLSTDTYDSYQWQTQNGSALSTSSTLSVTMPGTYKLSVTKKNARGEADPVTIGGQFDGINQNYVVTRIPSKKFKSTTGLEYKTENEVVESVQYFDGLGRTLQNISTRMSPSHRDIVQPFSYDQFSRESRKYLPYISSEDNGRFRQNASASEQPRFFQQPGENMASDSHPSAETMFDNSPLNRILKQGAVGSVWQPNADHPELEHVVKRQYSLNTAADSVMKFSYDPGRTVSLEVDTYFQVGTLYSIRTTDEDNNHSIEFADELDRTICRKVYAGSNVYATTYYIYDDIGNLVIVVPPEGTRSIVPVVQH